MPLRRLLRCAFPFLGLALGLLGGLASCQSYGDTAQAGPVAPPTGHYTGTLQVAGQPELRAQLEVRHPRPGHYDAELVLPQQAAFSFVADSLAFGDDTLRLARPGRPGETLALGHQGNFWRGTLRLDSVRYPLLLVRRGDPEPAVYRVRRDEVAGTTGPALLFSPADESLPGLGLALFATSGTALLAPSWADALARQGHTVLLLPAADTLAAPALANALALLRRTPGVDTARVGAWISGPPASLLPLFLAENTASRPAFVVVQNMPAPPLATRRDWRALAQHGHLLAIYDPSQPQADVAQARALLGRPRVHQASDGGLQKQVTDWLREK
ncbi:hypothetical protein GCM10023172_29820 [Hymenobacter ginsengisoli]|uniref:Alpha/beta hydrolase n=1 Tax=Hymenobacter ginsengisoli TaxID=1051626 RepID=A0ABP8QIY6_9BACT|nr:MULTISPECIES: hypothetical protein [unclassified Hymenobacter]MBO2029763.1 hypothetical protein [Hymenobacter sp. BT559]